MKVNPKFSAFLLSLVLFAAGAVGGILADRYFLGGKKWGRYAKFMGPKRFDIIREHLQRKLTRELQLDAGQQAQLQQILGRGMARIKEKSLQHDAEIEAMKEALRQEFAATLRPDQKERFWQFVQRFKSHRQRRHSAQSSSTN